MLAGGFGFGNLFQLHVVFFLFICLLWRCGCAWRRVHVPAGCWVQPEVFSAKHFFEKVSKLAANGVLGLFLGFGGGLSNAGFFSARFLGAIVRFRPSQAQLRPRGGGGKPAQVSSPLPGSSKRSMIGAPPPFQRVRHCPVFGPFPSCWRWGWPCRSAPSSPWWRSGSRCPSPSTALWRRSCLCNVPSPQAARKERVISLHN